MTLEEAVRLTHDVSARRGAPAPPAPPVLIFTGPRGQGKTHLIETLGRRLTGRAHVAGLDLADAPHDPFPGPPEGVATTDGDRRPVLPPAVQLLDRIVRDLDRDCAAYGRLVFPRFTAGLAVLGRGFARPTPQATRAAIGAAFGARGRLGAPLDRIHRLTLDEIVGGAAAGPVGLAAFTLYLLIGWARGDRGHRRAVLRWYRDADLGAGRQDALDRLTGLHHAAWHPAEGDNAALLAETLTAAFLADLAQDMDRRRRPFEPRPRCRRYDAVLLLDEADEPRGAELLTLLTGAGRAAPLTIVATARGRPSAPGRPAAAPVDLAAADAAELRGGGGWRHVPLPDRTLAEVTAALPRALPRAERHRTATAVHELTGGHPYGTARLLDALGDRPGVPVDLRALLWEPPGDPLVDGLVARLLRDVPPATVAALELCAAADPGELGLLRGGMVPVTRYNTALDVPVWRRDAAGDRELPPFLRTLLLERLRGSGEPSQRWRDAHEWLLGAAEARRDPVAELRHALALGRVGHVGRRLLALLDEREPAAWIELVEAVATAPPHRPPARTAALTGWAADASVDEPGQIVADLLAGLWVVSDPLCTADRATQYQDVAACLHNLDFLRRRGEPFRRAAERYAERAGTWR
ncbi:hypothetical protein [Actinomadura flavalba]|uniref:hypothetical protein n=1 Tax=Actinomadura flavalba TaxID=1120938 RepID=UPI0003618594|nr:hypothetical protein [Actinomadura flavalba]